MGGWRIDERLADCKSAIQQDAILRYKAKNSVLHPGKENRLDLACVLALMIYILRVNREVSIMKNKSIKLFGTSIIAAAALGMGAILPSAHAAETKTIKGEVVDLMCYLDHGAKGEKHASCAKHCIESGGPVGLLTEDNQLYLVIGEHQPMNEKLASLAAKTITLRGKVVERNGVKMIENAQIEK